MVIKSSLLTYTNHTLLSSKDVFLSKHFFFLTEIVIRMVCWGFRNIHSLNKWGSTRLVFPHYGNDGKQDWILKDSFMEPFTFLKDLSHFLYEIECLMQNF